MIEDLQDEYTSFNAKDPNEKNHDGMVLFVFILWVIYAATIALIIYPKVITTFRNTKAIEILKTRKEYLKETETTQVTLYFVSFTANSKPVYTAYKTKVKQTGVSAYHDAIEGLLKGPTDVALSYGSISMIPQGTKLIGITVSGKSAFVDLSSDFIVSYENGLDGNYINTSREQIFKTLTAINREIKEVILLVDGKEI